jgi:hypothetical protein
VSRAGIEPAKPRHTGPNRFTRSMTWVGPQNDESRLGDPAAFAKNLEKPPYLRLKSTKVNAGEVLANARAHDCPTTPDWLRLEQLKYTTAFMTRAQCTYRARFVNENFAFANLFQIQHALSGASDTPSARSIDVSGAQDRSTLPRPQPSSLAAGSKRKNVASSRYNS